MRLIIDLPSPEEATFIRRLLSKLNIAFVTEEPAHQASQATAFEALRAVAQRGEVARLIPDPAAWEKQERQDRDLPLPPDFLR